MKMKMKRDGPLGMNLMLRNMAIDLGYNLDESDPSGVERDDPVKDDFEELISLMGVTVQDLKAPITSYTEDEYNEWMGIKKKQPEEEVEDLPPSVNQEEDPLRKYQVDPSIPDGPLKDPPNFKKLYDDNKKKRTNDGEINKKSDDDDVPTLLATTSAAAASGDDKQMDADDEIKKDEAATGAAAADDKKLDGDDEIKKDEDDVYVSNKRLRSYL